VNGDILQPGKTLKGRHSHNLKPKNTSYSYDMWKQRDNRNRMLAGKHSYDTAANWCDSCVKIILKVAFVFTNNIMKCRKK
jgi:hypothetical protein